jgi:fluoride exporter
VAQLRLGPLVAIALGGALGAPARVELERAIPSGPGFAWGTLFVNVFGSFLLGLAAAIVFERIRPSGYLWPFFATGICGSFTTLSTLAVEVDLRLRSGNVAVGLAYAIVSLAAGLAAVIGGMGMARTIIRRRARQDTPDDRAQRRQSWS